MRKSYPSLVMKGVAVIWLFYSITLNVNSARMQAGDVYYACHSSTLLKQASLEKPKDFA